MKTLLTDLRWCNQRFFLFCVLFDHGLVVNLNVSRVYSYAVFELHLALPRAISTFFCLFRFRFVSLPLLSSVSCCFLSRFVSCRFAFLFRSRRYAPHFLGVPAALPGCLRVGLGDEEIMVRMTGCPNGCARPYMAELAFVGDGPDSYQVRGTSAACREVFGAGLGGNRKRDGMGDVFVL